MNQTPLPTQAQAERQWYVVDAANQRVGRLATQVAALLRGKHDPHFTPHLDAGEFVIVVNANKVVVTGKKAHQKHYYRHSHRPGGMKTETFAQLQRRIPERIVEQAVKGMLPKNKLGRQLARKLYVYPGPHHPHQAQKPQPLSLETDPGGN
ncbi:MAG: 50S ribosomal protein L13 [Cyanobacteria bacterium QS_8_64_29]|nr:MAG: 50S ribosomal protein L13 [Cyanobacteria bacterium QS_8_64_29]